MSDFVTRAREAHAAIKSLLLEWDPIGIAHCPEAQNEYDACVADLYQLLARRAELREVFEYLWSVETVQMGLQGNRSKTEQIAGKLVGLITNGVMPRSKPPV
jgi:hypothetical protein